MKFFLNKAASKKVGLAIFLLAFMFLKSLYAQVPPTATADIVTADLPVPANADASTELPPVKISLDFKDAEIGTVLRVISLKSGVNIVAGPEVVGVVTIRLEEVAWEKALDVILRTYNFVYERDGNVIRITTREKMQLEPVDTKTFILNYAKASEVITSIQDILTERGRVKVAERMNMLIVTDIPTNIFHISQVLERLDKKTPQAYIDSKIINTNVGVAEDLGINWGVQGGVTAGSSRPTTFPFPSDDGKSLSSAVEQFFPPVRAAGPNVENPRDFPGNLAAPVLTPTYTYGTLSFSNFSAILKMLNTHTSTKVVSNPRVVVLNNQTATVQVGSQIPIPNYERNDQTGSMEVSGFTYRDIGVVMKVTPHINDANEIIVDLAPEVSTQGANVSFQADFQAPSFNVTQAKTQVMMKSGETIAIGGLLTDNQDVSEAKVPYFSDIPLVGKLLFKSKRQTSGDSNEKSETLFFVTVTSVDSSGQPILDSEKKEALSSQNTAPTSVKNTASADASSVAGA